MKLQIKWSLSVSIAALCAVMVMGGPTPVLAADEWSPRQNLSAVGSVTDSPQITSSSDGTKLTATWYRSNGTNYIIQTASSTTSGTTWTTPTSLSTPGRSAFNPQITSSSDGTTLTVIWWRSDGANNIIQSASSTTSGTTWSTPTSISSPGAGAYDPQITSSSDGTKLTATWTRFDGANDIIQTTSSTTSGTTWTTPTSISTPGRNAYNPQITSSSDGTTLTAIWQLWDGTNYIIQTASSTTSGTTWTTPQDLSTPGGNANRPQITSSSDGTKLTATWYRSNGTHNIIQTASSTTSGTTWTTPQDLSTPGGSADMPQITSSGDGTRLAIVWKRFNGVGYIIQAALSSDSGATWTTPSDLSSISANSNQPQVTGSTDGARVTAIWSSDGNVIQISSLQRSFASATPPAPIVSLHHASLDPNGGTCVTNGIATTTSARTPFLGYSYIPGAEECTRTGFTFQGWAATTKPDTVIPLPLLRGWFDGIWRYFIANSYDLTAVWKPTG